MCNKLNLNCYYFPIMAFYVCLFYNDQQKDILLALRCSIKAQIRIIPNPPKSSQSLTVRSIKTIQGYITSTRYSRVPLLTLHANSALHLFRLFTISFPTMDCLKLPTQFTHPSLALEMLSSISHFSLRPFLPKPAEQKAVSLFFFKKAQNGCKFYEMFW